MMGLPDSGAALLLVNYDSSNNAHPVRAEKIMSTPATESLAAIPAGAEIEIVQDLLTSARYRDRVGTFRPGGRFRCRQNGAASILLTAASGKTISVGLDEARFIKVRRTFSN